MEDWRNGGFGLYLHWPFCRSKCPYCDFNSHVAARVDQGRWLRAYQQEIRRLGAETSGRVLDSVFFGGGTPSLMAPEIVAGILDCVRTTWPMVNDPEITLEANPGSVEAGRFEGYRAAGVNRVSIGFQALNDPDLRTLGRLHDVEAALEALAVARRHFDRVSFDLIYARQDQTLAAWEEELGRALALRPDHLSLYQLTIEEGTSFGDRLAKGGLRGLPDEDLAVDLFLATQSLCEVAGLPAYEISNHAAPGSESRHNLIYWRGGDYVGVGPGAHGRLTLGGVRWATEAPKAPGAWLAAVEAGRPGEAERLALTPQNHAEEYLLMCLRLSEGLDTQRHAQIGGTPLPAGKLRELEDLGLVTLENGRLAATREGRLVLNAILRELGTR